MLLYPYNIASGQYWSHLSKAPTKRQLKTTLPITNTFQNKIQRNDSVLTDDDHYLKEKYCIYEKVFPMDYWVIPREVRLENAMFSSSRWLPTHIARIHGINFLPSLI